MKYKFFGFKVPYKGKPIWEIVGNLKNFGVGRMIVADEHKDKFIAPTFYKIVRVVPLENPKNIGENRSVLLWAEYVLNGRKLTQLEQLQPDSCLNKFHLIHKENEEKYISGITNNPKITVIPKFQKWPPLFKITWEQRQLKARQRKVIIPDLETVIDVGEKSFEVLSTDCEFEEAPTSDLHKTDVPVEELFKRVALLRHELGIKDEPPEE